MKPTPTDERGPRLTDTWAAEAERWLAWARHPLDSDRGLPDAQNGRVEVGDEG